jgi:hypothetical protein
MTVASGRGAAPSQVERTDDNIALVPTSSRLMILIPSPGSREAEGGGCGRATGVRATVRIPSHVRAPPLFTSAEVLDRLSVHR